MPVKEISGRWHTVNKAGKVGKRAFKSRESAEAASSRGRALLGRTSTEDVGARDPGDSIVRENPDTAAERRVLGIPAKEEDVDTGGF